MPVPYTFGSATSAIPLSQLDANFATTITLGNTAIQLGNTVTTLNNMTLANVTISSGSVTITSATVTSANVTSTLTLSGLTASTALALDASKNVVSVTNTGTGNNVLATSPTLVTPVLGTPTSGTLTNCTGLPLSTGVTGTLGTTNGGTGLTSFTANGVVYASSSSALTTGSALTFDGTNFVLGTGGTSGGFPFTQRVAASGSPVSAFRITNGSDSTFDVTLQTSLASIGNGIGSLAFLQAGTESMRLTSTGLGIGTSSPAAKLDVNSSGAVVMRLTRNGGTATNTGLQYYNGTNSWYAGMSAGGLYAIGYNDANLDVGQIRLDSSGNLGLGVTPSAWLTLASTRAMQIGNLTLQDQASGGVIYSYLGSNYYQGTDTNFKYTTTNFATQYEQSSGRHIWRTAPSGTAGTAISFTQAATLGGTSAPYFLVGTTVNVQSFPFQTVNQNGFAVHNAAETATAAYFAAGGAVNLTSAGNFAVINGADGVLFGAASTERARITSGGDLLVGTSSGQVAATVVAYRSSAATACVGSWNAATSGDNVFEVFNTEATATQRGSIDYNRAGGLTRYNITSDYRAKDIIGPAQNTGATIDALKVYEGMMKGATQTRPMMIAHEAQAVVPFCVSGTKDEINEDGTPKYQQMDHASLVPLLIAEIQSLRARVAALETK